MASDVPLAPNHTPVETLAYMTDCYAHSRTCRSTMDSHVPLAPYHTPVETLADMTDCYAWFAINAVRVIHIWQDDDNSRMLLWLLDNRRVSMLAILPNRLRRQIMHTHFRGRLFKVINVRVEQFYFDHPKYNGYMINMEDWHILIHPTTTFIPLDESAMKMFPKFPFVTSVATLSADTGKGKNLRDVLGRIAWGKQRTDLDSFEMFLQDESGNIIKTILKNLPANLVDTINVAVLNKSTIYVSRMKLVHKHSYNILVSTFLTDFEVEPNMHEAHRIRGSFCY